MRKNRDYEAVPKLLSLDQKKERVDSRGDFLALLRWHSLALLNNIVTKDECAVSFHTPETKRASKQWVKKGQPGPRKATIQTFYSVLHIKYRKAKVHGTRTKKMMFILFYAKGVIYTNYLNKVKTVNTKYIKKVLARFQGEEADHVVPGLVSPLGQRPGPYRRYGPGVSGGGGVKTLRHPPYSPDLAPADFFLFPRVKSELAGLSMNQETFQKS